MPTLILFPHQLYFDLSRIQKQNLEIYLVEEHLFFTQYAFHKQKIAFHRASMRCYADSLQESGFVVNYIDSTSAEHDIRLLLPKLIEQNKSDSYLFEPDDYLLKRRINRIAAEKGLIIKWLENQLFINTHEELNEYKTTTKRLFQTDFYIHQRKKRGILLDDFGGPIGGKWSFDADNRLKYPKNKVPPSPPMTSNTAYHEEAKIYVQQHFSHHVGTLDSNIVYPITPNAAEAWLDDFLKFRFAEFGPYEDAIVAKEQFLHHSLLTPMLNVGILKPQVIIDRVLNFVQTHDIQFNNVEGFIRQILGWREFVRYAYREIGVKQRKTNFWGFSRKIPASFYDGSTGIRPVDDAIQKLNKSGYNHHIERLMILSNFMLLCEFDPDEVYRWFMEMYIDSYDWVMVPNVYGMGQFSDGGLMVSKPYISGSNYLFKMSDYKKGEPWAEIWDALFWRFLSVNRDFFQRNPRLSMLISTFDKWEEGKKSAYLEKAEDFLNGL